MMVATNAYNSLFIVPLQCPLAWASGYKVHIWLSWRKDAQLEEMFVRTIGLDGVC